MTGFDVDENALYAYVDVLKRYAGHAEYLGKYIGKDGPDVAVAFTPNMGPQDIYVVYRHLAKVHLMHLTRAGERIDAMKRVAKQSSETLDQAARYYDTTDKESAARFDASLADDPNRDYPVGRAREIRKESPEDVYKAFDDRDPTELVRRRDKESDSPKEYKDRREVSFKEVKQLEEWVSYFSPAHWIREALAAIYGKDPLNMILRYLGGDWPAWYRAMVSWEVTAEAVATMFGNAGLHFKLEHYWVGVAADAAQAYFSRFKNATYAEARDYYRGYLVPFYREMTHLLMDTHAGVTKIVDALIDLCVGVGIVRLFKLIASGEAAEVVKMIMDLMGRLDHLLTAFEEGAKERSGAHLGDEPDCEMETLKRYLHPMPER